jgi:hypothetical protein
MNTTSPFPGAMEADNAHDEDVAVSFSTTQTRSGMRD